jgi:hypothetical protein
VPKIAVKNKSGPPRRARNVSGQRCGLGRLEPFPADVADHERPAVAADFEEIVEIADEFDAGSGRTKTSGDVESRNRRQRRRQQTGLQRLRDRFGVQARPAFAFDRRAQRDFARCRIRERAQNLEVEGPAETGEQVQGLRTSMLPNGGAVVFRRG